MAERTSNIGTGRETVDVSDEAEGMPYEGDPSPVGDTELDKAPERIKKFGESRRFRRAKQLITRQGRLFWCYVPNIENRITEEPADYSREDYEGRLQDYTDYKHTYMVDYDIDGVEWRWWRWRNHSDIGVNVIERKMPIDKNIRSIITAFKMLVIKNQKTHVIWKRFIQLSFAALLFAGIWASYSANMAILDMLGLEPGMLQSTAVLAGMCAIAAGFTMFAHRLAVIWLTSTLRAGMGQSATSLKSAMNRKTSRLQNQFESVLARAKSANNEYRHNQREWIESAIWYAEVAMWLPKRVDYIERYFQLEMQNIRAGRNGLAIIGDFVSRLILVTLLVVAGGGALWLGGNSSLTALILFVFTGLALAVMYHQSTNRKNSIQNTEIRDWIGERSWNSVSEFNMFQKVSDIMRPYLNRVFIEDNKGATPPNDGEHA